MAELIHFLHSNPEEINELGEERTIVEYPLHCV